MLKTIAIAAGGYSGEYEVSINSAAQVAARLSADKFRTFVVEITRDRWVARDADKNEFAVDKNDFAIVTPQGRIRPDAVFMAIHGTPGEDGKLQGYFDMLGIPHTTCHAFTAALTFNKFACKNYLQPHGIRMAPSILLRRGEAINSAAIADTLGMPCFVKPNNNGSSVGVSKVNTLGELQPAIEKIFPDDDEVIIERFIKGREFSCGVFKSGADDITLPVTEIISKKEFFDYEAKYTSGMSEEITPADLSPLETLEIQTLSSRIYSILNCRGMCRVDFILSDGIFYFLEINTVPGMSTNSIIPQQLRAAGYQVDAFYSMVATKAAEGTL